MKLLTLILSVFAGALALAGLVLLLTPGDGNAPPSTVAGVATTTLPATDVTGSTAPPTTAVAGPRFEESQCRFSYQGPGGVRCGYLVVPADRSQPSGPEVRLHVAIVSSDNPEPRPDPIVYLEGGPGGDALETVPFSFEDRFGPYVADRDVVIFDQRGTGYSEPSLACPESRRLDFELLDDILPPDEYVDRQLEAIGECRDRLLDQGIDLSWFDSAASAADVADLRRVLGYDEWNLYGISYGTRLALTVLRDHPEGVRSVILDSSYPPPVDGVAEFVPNADRAFAELFAACAADADCSATYPDLERRYYDLVDRLDLNPLAVPVTDVFTGDAYEAALDGAGLLGLTFQALYSSELVPLLPSLVAELERGEVTTTSRLITNFLAQGEFLSLGVLLSVQCREEIAYSDRAAVDAAVEASPYLGRLAATSLNAGPPAFQMCEDWRAGEAGPGEVRPVRSDVPTLVLAGGFDPITPPAWAGVAARPLPNSTVVEFGPLGHGVSSGEGCAAEVAVAFLDDPTETPDMSCVDSLPPPDFVPGEAFAEVELDPFTDQINGVTVTGVAPHGWSRVAPGSFARLATPVDPTALYVQGAEGIDREELLGLLAIQLGFNEPDAPSGTHQSSEREWSLYDIELQGSPAVLALTQTDDISGVAILVSVPSETDSLRQSVLLPALDAFDAA